MFPHILSHIPEFVTACLFILSFNYTLKLISFITPKFLTSFLHLQACNDGNYQQEGAIIFITQYKNIYFLHDINDACIPVYFEGTKQLHYRPITI